MAFSRGIGERPESLLFRSPQSPRDEPAYKSPLSPLRSIHARATQPPQSSGDLRGSLQRRFTTNALPTLSPIGQQRRQAADPRDYNNTNPARMTPAEKKARFYEDLLAQQRRLQAQMALIDPETRREVDEVQRMEQDIARVTSGFLSEPTTPPEYHSVPFIAKPLATNRYSTSSMTTPSGFFNRSSRSGSQLTSPPVSAARPFTSHATSHLPSRSVPGSQRNSDHEDEDEDFGYGFTDVRHRASANPNRNSMPVTAQDIRTQQSNTMANLQKLLGSVNTTSYLFGDEDEAKPIRQVQTATTSPDAKTYLQLHATDDKFPILVRRENDGNTQFSASSAALDLALSQSPGPEELSRTDRTTATRHRQSLPPSAMRQIPFLGGDGTLPLNGLLSDIATATAQNTAANRRSMEVKFGDLGQAKRPTLLGTPPNGTANGLPRLQSSYSTNDIPTLKSTNVASPESQNSVAVQSPIYDVASPIRSPQSTLASAVMSPISRTSLGGFQSGNESANGYRQATSGLQASAAPFGPTIASPTGDSALVSHPVSPQAQAYGAPAYYGGYGMQMMNASFNNMYLGNQGQWPVQAPNYQGSFGGYSQFPQQSAPRFPDNQTRVMQQRRTQNGDDSARFNNVQLESLVGEIYGLCKDQHGCRYLQKKLEDRNPEHLQLIFEETNPHVVELMTDPFGNYLCQKLLEYANDDQRTELIRSAAPQMVKIALNQHGTRALQKTIEFISTRQQINMVIESLRNEVVQLIQDLNGNHVIQKCLNHLAADDAQFVIDAVCAHVVVVGTHRHGCCVLQRCIDHASGLQKGQLVHAITLNAFTLVQDPFGNYVVQYILDLGEPSFSEPLCRSFAGNIPVLSRQKFSSNVIEKAIRVADAETRRQLIEEMLHPSELDLMLRDSFANYVVQTAMDYADPETKRHMLDSIRPVLPTIRHTPHGRRIASKLQDHEGRTNGASSGQMTPTDIFSPVQAALGNQPATYGRHGHKASGNFNMSANNVNGNQYSHGLASPISQRNAGQPMFSQQTMYPHGFPTLNRAAQPNGTSHY